MTNSLTTSNNALVKTLTDQLSKADSLDDFLREGEGIMLLLDTSGSMSAAVDINEPEGKRAIDALREIVAELTQAGGVPMIAFGGPWDAEVRFVEVVPDPHGGTPLHLALDLAREYGATRVVVVSDGMPDDKIATLTAAKKFGGRLDVMFVKHSGVFDAAGGEKFLEQLAKSTGGGKHSGSLKDVKQIARTVLGLLEGNIEEEKKPIIQGAGFSIDPDAAPAADDSGEFDDDDDEDGDDDE